MTKHISRGCTVESTRVTHAVIKVILGHIRKCPIWQKVQMLKIHPK